MNLHASEAGSSEVQLVELQQRPDWLPVLAQWHQREWPDKGTYANRLAAFRQYLGPRKLPVTLVLAVEQQPVGNISLLQYHGSTSSLSSFWVANVYVVPQRRGSGFGRLLVRAIEAVARRHQIPQLYLYTTDKCAFYRRLGWDFSFSKTVGGEVTKIMRRSL